MAGGHQLKSKDRAHEIAGDWVKFMPDVGAGAPNQSSLFPPRTAECRRA